jgi:Zn-dependent protease
LDRMHSFAGALLSLVPMVLSLTVHEFAHAWSARRLGDDTAERLGRLSLNPIRHIDPVGTLLLPVLLTMQGWPAFGWARPVPFDPRKLTRRLSVRTSSMLISFAGPFSNLVLALVSAALLSVVVHLGLLERAPEALVQLAATLVPVNIGLFLFNMIPLGPLDGRAVLVGLLPGSAADVFESLNRQLGVIALIAAMFVAPRILGVPLQLLHDGLFTLVGLGRYVRMG